MALCGELHPHTSALLNDRKDSAYRQENCWMKLENFPMVAPSAAAPPKRAHRLYVLLFCRTCQAYIRTSGRDSGTVKSGRLRKIMGQFRESGSDRRNAFDACPHLPFRFVGIISRTYIRQFWRMPSPARRD